MFERYARTLRAIWMNPYEKVQDYFCISTECGCLADWDEVDVKRRVTEIPSWLEAVCLKH